VCSIEKYDPPWRKLRGIFLSAAQADDQTRAVFIYKKQQVIDWRLAMDGTKSSALFLPLLFAEILRLMPIAFWYY